MISGTMSNELVPAPERVEGQGTHHTQMSLLCHCDLFLFFFLIVLCITVSSVLSF